jgi:hypothetical protein
MNIPLPSDPPEIVRCASCIHFGELRGVRGIVRSTVCLAPITTEPPPDGTTVAKHRFVYEASAHGECELWTPNDQADRPEADHEH